MDWKQLSSNQRFFLNVIIPSMYLVPLVGAFLLPKHFGFGFTPLIYFGLAIGAAGMLLWIGAMFSLGPRLAVLPGASDLVTRGVYRYLRHPLYVGIVLALLGLFLACGSIFGLAFLVLGVVPLNVARARWEDRALQEQFGEAYATYRRRTWF
ncbi:MAG: hypothetical protein COV67_10160 [Nitrospinae bacterium CG11_big_fil_rev_8_21_14_0_20_56_8]|nr:MAG: hypothetical protein COV67_10160 [Nitrospinae bacterium CG11_big_fil_rev_8_21_14_0_20_56_8]